MSDQEIKKLLKEIRSAPRCQIYDDLVEDLSAEELKELKGILR
jgi:hypothetical protein